MGTDDQVENIIGEISEINKNVKSLEINMALLNQKMNVPFPVSQISFTARNFFAFFLVICFSVCIPSIGFYYSFAYKIDSVISTVNYHISDKNIHCNKDSAK